MPDTEVTLAKRRQALGIGVFMAALALGTTLAFHALRRDDIAWRRGEIAYSRGDYETAAAQYARAYDLGLRDRDLPWRYAAALMESDRQAEALPLLEELIAKDPPDLRAVEAAAGIAQGLGQPERARDYYARLGSARELSPAELVRLADIHQQAGRLDDAIDCYRRALAAAPGSADLHTALGQVLAWAGRRDEALPELQAALRLNPAHPTARIYLARVLSWEGRLADAIAAYRTYLGE